MKEKVKINRCFQCPFFNKNEDLNYGLYSTGRFEPYCNKSKKEILDTPVEKDELKNVLVPDWCEIRAKKVVLEIID